MFAVSAFLTRGIICLGFVEENDVEGREEKEGKKWRKGILSIHERYGGEKEVFVFGASSQLIMRVFFSSKLRCGMYGWKKSVGENWGSDHVADFGFGE